MADQVAIPPEKIVIDDAIEAAINPYGILATVGHNVTHDTNRLTIITDNGIITQRILRLAKLLSNIFDLTFPAIKHTCFTFEDKKTKKYF